MNWQAGSRICALLVAAACAFPACAQEKETYAGGSLSLVFENDFFANNDRHYTGGLRVSWLAPPGVPSWLDSFARVLPSYSAGRTRVEYALGQSVYTPTDIERVPPDPNDRPYAGWLYGSIGVVANGDSQLDLLQLTIGVVGPASGAKDTQLFFHDLTNSREPKGWSSQLKNELGLNLTYQHVWRGAATRTVDGMDMDFSPHVGGALGNIHTYANAGFMLRFGERLPPDYGPPRIEPSLPGSSYFVPGAGLRWYLFAGVDVRLVARNIFLDGNTFRDSPSVDKENWVGDLQGGIVFDWGRTRIAYTHVVRSREFKTQDRHDQFGAVTISMSF